MGALSSPGQNYSFSFCKFQFSAFNSQLTSQAVFSLKGCEYLITETIKQDVGGGSGHILPSLACCFANWPQITHYEIQFVLMLGEVLCPAATRHRRRHFCTVH